MKLLIYPTGLSSNDHRGLSKAPTKRSLNQITSAWVLSGSAGFLKVSHMDVVSEAFGREVLIASRIMTRLRPLSIRLNPADGEAIDVSNQWGFGRWVIPVKSLNVKARSMVPQEFVGALMEMTQHGAVAVTADYIRPMAGYVIIEFRLLKLSLTSLTKLRLIMKLAKLCSEIY